MPIRMRSSDTPLLNITLNLTHKQLGYLISTFGFCLNLITNLKVVRDQILLFEKGKCASQLPCAHWTVQMRQHDDWNKKIKAKGNIYSYIYDYICCSYI